MDKDTRNRIQRATQDARALLEREYGEQLEGVFDIRLDGTIAKEPGSHLDARQRVLRTKLVAAVEHVRAGGIGPAEAVGAYLREAAFTTLNRFVALKMLEARGLVQECISRGDQSPGFKEFTGLAPGLVQLPDHGYRLYIESIFDEVGREVRVLFDRRDPASLLWPRRQALQDLLAVLNATELAGVWDQDETIGWVYQYFNSDDERKQMRAESQAPRNSRELAVRNQFFTPRYVVQFLTDNTLGRIWYEMRQGDTQLRDLDYLVRRPNQVFLAEDEEAPADADPGDEDLSQEDLLQRPVHVPFRAKKDPRDIRVLDPACGSGHFLLYAFDLLLAPYEEAWADDASPASEATGRTLRDDYLEIETLRATVPGLILRHNLHGIDIDARCAQIAALALWMRAQRAYKDLGIARDARPPIQKTNIVVAEPMPGEPELRREFVATLEPKLARLVERVFDRMELAGAAGSLLRIEEDIREAVQEIFGGHGELFRATDEQRWQQAETNVLRALWAYAERAVNGRTYQRRLFSEDAARGLGFIDLCNEHYDVVLMNPPFGAEPVAAADYVRKRYPVGYVDLACSFIDGAVLRTTTHGYVGVIMTRTPLFLSSFEGWRRNTLLESTTRIGPSIDLGVGVLDAMVETAAITIAKNAQLADAVFVDCREGDDKATMLTERLRATDLKLLPHADAARIPGAALSYWSGELLDSFTSLPRLHEFAEFFVTSRTGDDPRFVRAFWEVLPESLTAEPNRRWRRLSKGGAYAALYTPIDLVVDWRGDGGLLGESLYLRRPREGYCWGPKSRTHAFMGTPGLIWSSRSQKGLSFRLLPADCATTNKSLLLTSGDPDRDLGLLVLLNRRRTQDLAQCMTAFGAYERGTIEQLPIDPKVADVHADVGRDGFLAAREIAALRETDPHHVLLCRHDVVSVHALLQEIREDARAHLGVVARSLEEDANGGSGPDARIGELASWIGELGVEDVAFELLGYAFGHWDLDQVRGRKRRNAGAPFEALPVRQPARPEATQRPVGVRAGILSDDPGSRNDCVDELRATARYIWQDEADAALAGIGEELGSGSVRKWLRETAFSSHLSRYTASRRTAPIYWQLATPSASYSVWLYYHRFTRDTFYGVLNDYVTPKLKHEERKLTSLTQDADPNPSAGQRKELDVQERFVSELRAFYEEVARIAPLWNPDLNDGVIVNFAPLWRLVPQHRAWQKECKSCWEKLVKGDYDWAHLAMHLWPERVVPKCAEDRSLAIAHGLEDELWHEDGDGKWQPRKVEQATIDKLIKERSSAAVKDALKKLLDAPAPATTRASKRKKAARRSGSRRAASSRPEASNGATEPGKRGSAGGEVLDKVKEAIAQNGDGASKAEVLEATGISAGQWNAAIKALVADGVVVQTGERRGARYHLAETGGES